MGLFDFFSTPPTPGIAAEKLGAYAFNESFTEHDRALASNLNVEIQDFIKERKIFRISQTFAAMGYVNHQKYHPNIVKMIDAFDAIAQNHLNSDASSLEQERIMFLSKAKRDYALEMPETLAKTMIKRLTKKPPQPEHTSITNQLTEHLKIQTRSILLQAADLAEKMRKQWAI